MCNHWSIADQLIKPIANEDEEDEEQEAGDGDEGYDGNCVDDDVKEEVVDRPTQRLCISDIHDANRQI